MQRFARHGHRYSHAWLSCPLIRSGLELSNPLVFGFFFCFLFHPVFHIIFPLFFCLFFFSPSVSFLASLTPPGPCSSQMGGTGFTLPASADSEPPRFPPGL